MLTRTALALLLGFAVAGCQSSTPVEQVPLLPPLECPAPATFEVGKTPTAVRHVAVTGDDTRGDGSDTRPFKSIKRALEGIQPGTAVYVHAGTYEGEVWLVRVRGTADTPIWVMGAPGEKRPTITAGNQGLYITQPRYLVLAHLEISYTNDNGINVDDGDRVTDDEAARYVVFRDLDVHDTGRQPSGVADCLKLTGVSDFVVVNSHFARCGSGEAGAVGVGGIGTHRGLVQANAFEDDGYGGVQFKGGASDVDVVANQFAAVGFRAANLGGSTGARTFRPPLKVSIPNVQATRIHMKANVVLGGESSAAFVGCVDCSFERNSVINPSRWALRVLQENVSIDTYAFAPTSKGRIADNVFYFKRGDLSYGEDINVGANTETESFVLSGNVWFAHDTPGRSRPVLPNFKGTQNQEIVGTAPTFVDAASGDFRVPAGPTGFPPGAPSSCIVGPTGSDEPGA